RFHVGRSRTVAALAAGALGGQVSRRDALVMRILVKVEPDVGVADFASFAADVAGGWSLGAGAHDREQEENDGQHTTTISCGVSRPASALRCHPSSVAQNVNANPAITTMSCSSPLIFAPGASAITFRGKGVMKSWTSKRSPMRLETCALIPA